MVSLALASLLSVVLLPSGHAWHRPVPAAARQPLSPVASSGGRRAPTALAAVAADDAAAAGPAHENGAADDDEPEAFDERTNVPPVAGPVTGGVYSPDWHAAASPLYEPCMGVEVTLHYITVNCITVHCIILRYYEPRIRAEVPGARLVTPRRSSSRRSERHRHVSVSSPEARSRA